MLGRVLVCGRGSAMQPGVSVCVCKIVTPFSSGKSQGCSAAEL